MIPTHALTLADARVAATAAEAEARVVAARPGVKLRQAQRAFLMSLAPETADHLPTAEQLNRSF